MSYFSSQEIDDALKANPEFVVWLDGVDPDWQDEYNSETVESLLEVWKAAGRCIISHSPKGDEDV